MVGVMSGFFIVLMIIGTSVGVSLAITGIFLMIQHGGIPLSTISQIIFDNLTSYTFVAIPFFIFAGNLLMYGPILTSIVNFANQLFKKVTGGLAIGVMFVSIFFGAISGSSAASTAAIGGATSKAMESLYPKKFVAGLVASGGTLGLMIPPSLAFIVIGGIIGIPIMDLFTAGLGAGIIQGLILCVTVYIIAKVRGWKPASEEKEAPKVYFGKLGKYLLSSWAILLLPVFIIGGIFMGVFTPTEIAAVSAIYALFLVMVVYKALTGKELVGVIKDSIYKSCMIYLIIIGAHIFSYALTRFGVSQAIIDFLVNLEMTTWQFLLVVNLLLLFLGMFMDGSAMTVLMAPLLFPLAAHFGIDPVHFAVIMVANSELGTLTPPVGINLFVMSGVSKMPVMDVARGVAPFFIALIIFLLLVTYIPAISLFLL
ncbi:TRAP transporter large permease [Lysinibacillus endophyticus]|uniref:TRAP transporter large permease n=1 Tax=Ureibacillus endophyticus TaxID=1978490 RepID=UPI00209E5DF6|nr:TRAP transporter large permease [Lysinibacillus endophyticus]MCP1146221.1 TRAP transporter large permease [Lysinibacillus endophyticus]